MTLENSSVWRPLYDDIKSWPLAVGDGSLIQETDLTVVDQVRRYSRGEGYVVRYRPGYKWYYLSNMRRDEVLLLKNFDTADVPAKCKTVCIQRPASPSSPVRTLLLVALLTGIST